jgi:glutamyl-tRNA reductase
VPLVCIGVSHHTAPLEVREKLTYPEADLAGALRDVSALPSVREALIFSTCNRTELYAVTEAPETATAELRRFLARTRATSGEELEKYLFEHAGEEAVRHLFRVSSSLDSMVLGEPQILGQVKAAYATAREAGVVSTVLQRCMERALGVAKQVRTDTGIARNAVSVSYVAVELARKVLGELRGKTVLLVGAGKMGELSATHLRQGGAARVLVANRSPEKAAEMAARFEGEGHGLERLETLLVDADVAITSTAAKDFVIRRDMMQRVMRARRRRSLVLVDIAVPRDVDPRCNEIDDVYVYDMDDLNKVIQMNLAARSVEAEAAERIVAAEATRFEEWLGRQKVVPTIKALREKYTAIAQAEAERALAGLGGGDEKTRAAVARMAEALVNKFLHLPTTALQRGDPDQALGAARMLFDLPAGGAASASPGPSPIGDALPESVKPAAAAAAKTSVK